MSTISVLCNRGDLSLTWDAANPRQTDKARRFFDRLFGENYIAFVPATEGGAARQTREFEPSADNIVMARPIVGG